MSASNPPPAALDPSAARVVLFGMPDAGKTSLLGALSQAAHAQQRALHGSIADLTDGLADLRRRVYDERTTETTAEIVPYPIRYTPAGAQTKSIVLFDCDGRAANDFLTAKRAIAKGKDVGPLAEAVLNADALVLVVDASASEDQMSQDFREFLRFLRLLERDRKHGYEIGGLPVFLALTKCDRLARERMSRSTWEGAIAAKREDVRRRFQDFLAADAAIGPHAGPLTFGTVELEVRATAVRKPELADAVAHPREPYGVAELFSSAIDEAVDFRDRRRRAGRRLAVTATAAGGFLAAMLAIGAMFAFSPVGPRENSLADRVEYLAAHEGATAAERLGPGLDRRLKEWLAVQSNPAFTALPEALQDLVRRRLDEGAAYSAYRDAIAAVLPTNSARSATELGIVSDQLHKIAPPEAYRSEWDLTEAGLARARRLSEEIPAIRAAVGQLTQFFFNLKSRSMGLLNQEAVAMTADWVQRVDALGEEAGKQAPVARTDPALGFVYAFDEVALAEADWQRSYERLARVRDLATALGLIAEADGAKAPLAAATGADAAESASRRWQNLRMLYPEFRKWSLADVPDAARPEFEGRLRRALEGQIQAGRKLILERLKAVNPTDREIPADWPRVAEYLLSDTLKDFRDLTAFVARLLDPKAEGPVEATAAFLRRPSFELSPRRIRIRIPDTLSESLVKPAGDLTLVYRASDGSDAVRRPFKPEGEPVRDKQALVYTFAADGAVWSYKPGDTFFAELAVRRGDRDQKFTWATSRTMAYQFERVVREPRMHAPDQNNADGIDAAGVSAHVVEGDFPAVPAMVPAVRLSGSSK